LFSFVRPSTDESVNLVGSTVSAAVMSVMRECFANEARLGAMRRAVGVLDAAGVHAAGDRRVPEGVHLVRLPACSPELQPAVPTARRRIKQRPHFPTISSCCLIPPSPQRAAASSSGRTSLRSPRVA
jgi:hypothetical protein